MPTKVDAAYLSTGQKPELALPSAEHHILRYL
jgi:hypothetical protein